MRLAATTSLLFALLRVALWPARKATIEVREPIDWESLYRLAADEGVLALAWDGVQEAARRGVLTEEQMPSRMLKLQWAVNVERIEARYRKQEEALASLATFYGQHAIRLMLLKGYGLSLRYPIPEHRPCGDLDIWLYGEQERADRLLRERGVVIDEDKHHHTVFTIKGVTVENHYDFLNVHSHRSNREVEGWLQALAREQGEQISLKGGTIELPSPDFNALFLLRHAAAHFAAAEIGLRHLVDWVVFVRSYGAQVNWERLNEQARAVNMHRFLAILNRQCVDHLGLERATLPASWLLAEPDDRLTARVLAEILSPRYGDAVPRKGILRVLWFKLCRWWSNRWKHRIVYREGLVQTFFVQLWSHLLKPKSFTH